MTLVDTNVIIDILLPDPVWLTWSAERLEESRRSGALCINEIGYAELSGRTDSESTLRFALERLGIDFQRIPTAGLFAAGQTFRRYRTAGGPRLNVLADFFIGAHAQVAAIPLLTRDTRRYRTYFPDVELIAPAA